MKAPGQLRALVAAFRQEVRSLVRSRTAAILTVLALGWSLGFPYFVRGDGTVAGAREMLVHYALGGVFAMLVVALVAAAAGSLAVERDAKRLQLALIRPAGRFTLALGRIAAQTVLGAAVLAVAAATLFLRVDPSTPCNHVLKPMMPTPRAEAEAMYESYLKDPETPERIRRASRETVLGILEQKAWEHYQAIGTNATARWNFSAPGEAVRLRFTNHFEMRQDVCGVFRSGSSVTVFSNQTQAVVTVPLAKGGDSTLAFENRGKNALMLRPRRDLDLLVGADGFAANLLRAYLQMVSLLALVIAAGTLLGAGLGRPVALFTAFAILTVSEMSPSVLEQYPDELSAGLGDRIGLAITRFAAGTTRSVSEMSPLEALSRDECVEWGETCGRLAGQLLFAPVVFSLLAAFVMPRKREE